MKAKLLGIFFFLLSGYTYSADNTLTVDTGNTLRNVSVGDKIINIKEMNGDIKIELTVSKNADEGLKKLNDLINNKKFSLNRLKGFSEISYIKEKNTMYIREHRSSKLTEMNCYTGKMKYLGKVVSSRAPSVISPGLVGPSCPVETKY